MAALQKRYRQLSFFWSLRVNVGSLGGSTVRVRPAASKQRVQSTAYLSEAL
jgi:hypothetical protein